MGVYNALTIEEERFIKEHIRDMTIAQIATSLGRSYSTIQQNCKLLGFKMAHRWTSEEDEFLLKNYNSHIGAAAEIASELGVNVDSVYNRIRRLKKQNIYKKKKR